MIDPREVERAIAEEVKRGAAQPDVDEFTEQVADTVRDFSPVGTGKFRRSIKTNKTGRLDGNYVYSDDDPEKVEALEYGTSDTEAFSPFAKAALKHR